jgi:hypothetical protein
MSRKILEIIKKHGPKVLGVIAVDGFLHNKRESFRDQYTQQAIKAGLDSTQAAQQGKAPAEYEYKKLENNLTLVGEKVDSSTKDVNKYTSRVEDINKELNNKDLSPIDRSL